MKKTSHRIDFFNVAGGKPSHKLYSNYLKLNMFMDCIVHPQTLVVIGLPTVNTIPLHDIPFPTMKHHEASLNAMIVPHYYDSIRVGRPSSEVALLMFSWSLWQS